MGNTGPLRIFRPKGPREWLSIDHSGPYPLSEKENKYITSIVDRWSGKVFCKSVKAIDAKTTALTIVESCLEWGVPKKLLSDRGSDFLSHLCLNVCKVLSIKKLNTTAYYPQTNGAAERFHYELKLGFKQFTLEKPLGFGLGTIGPWCWDDFVVAIRSAHNNKWSRRCGMTPNEAFFGFFTRSIGDSNFEKMLEKDRSKDYKEVVKKMQVMQAIVFEISKLRLEEYDRKRKLYYDKNHRTVNFEIGDIVQFYVGSTYPGNAVVKRFNQIAWICPLVITSIWPDGTAKIRGSRLPDGEIVNWSKLRLYVFSDVKVEAAFLSEWFDDEDADIHQVRSGFDDATIANLERQLSQQLQNSDVNMRNVDGSTRLSMDSTLLRGHDGFNNYTLSSRRSPSLLLQHPLARTSRSGDISMRSLPESRIGPFAQLRHAADDTEQRDDIVQSALTAHALAEHDRITEAAVAVKLDSTAPSGLVAEQDGRTVVEEMDLEDPLGMIAESEELTVGDRDSIVALETEVETASQAPSHTAADIAEIDHQSIAQAMASQFTDADL